MNKPFEGKTIVRNKEFGIWLTPVAALEKVSLEDPDFDKRFDVYSSDQVEARYVLTPTFMERISELAMLMKHWGDDPSNIRAQTAGLLFSSGSFRCSFYNDSILLMVDCDKDLFAPGNLFAPAFHTNAIRCVLYQVHLIRGIIETLKLNQHIGM
jgi:hypothetical protein